MSKLWIPDRKLHLPTIELIGFYLEVGAWDKAGKLYHQQRMRSQSPVKQLLQFILAGWSASSITITRIDSTTKAISSSAMSAVAGLNVDNLGIIIGTGTTAVDITDYVLETRIRTGSTSGKMIYNAVAFDADVTVSDPDCTFEMWRNFNNNSGASITVRETGIYIQASSVDFCVVRDVPTSVAVPDGGGCYVKYTLKITE